MLKEYKGAKDEDNQKLKSEVKALRERLIAQQQPSSSWSARQSCPSSSCSRAGRLREREA